MTEIVFAIPVGVGRRMFVGKCGQSWRALAGINTRPR